MSANYYYLVASLPDIAMDLEARDVDIISLKEEVRINIPKSHYAHVDTLFAPYDIENLLSMVLKKDRPFHNKGRFSQEELLLTLAQPKQLPAFMAEFVEKYYKPDSDEQQHQEDEPVQQDNNTWMAAEEDDEQLAQPSDPEISILSQFYDYALASRCSFIRRWFSFDRDMRNFKAALSARRMDLDPTPYLMGSNEVVEALTNNKSTDFGLRESVDYVEKLLQIADTADMMERERRFDMLRWEKADELALSDNFNINNILAFLQKADIADRWLSLDKQTGMDMFRRLLKDIQSEFDIQQTLSKEGVLDQFRRK